MTTPQQPRVRRKQKARRSKKLAAWREKHPAEAKKTAGDKTASRAPAKKAAANANANAKKAPPAKKPASK